MSFKKKMLSLLAVGALSAVTAVPAMALENEFHGMFRFLGYQSNAINGQGGVTVRDGLKSGFYAEQRARLMYIAKANDNLKLVTHFELDSRFGGITAGYKGTTGNDSGNLDADTLTLETKNIYLDFNVAGANAKLGIQPWVDSYSGIFLTADMTGAYVTKKFDPLTLSLGWFRFDDNTPLATATTNEAGDLTADLFVLDGKFALNKNLKVGASYYYIKNDSGVTTSTVTGASANTLFDQLHTLGLNADLAVGPVNVKPFAAYQFGEVDTTHDISAYLLGAVTKTKLGPIALNVSGFYLSGDKNATGAAGDHKDFKVVSATQSYFNPGNMWLLLRNGQQINTSNSVLGNDLTVNGRGSLGLFAGVEGGAGKVFYNANVGHMRTAEERTAAGVEEDNTIGTELNATVGYKLYDNLSVSATAAYVFLGDALNSATAGKRVGGGANADDPYLTNIQFSYVF